MDDLYLISDNGSVSKVEVMVPRVCDFFQKERQSFPEKADSLGADVQAAIKSKGGSPEELMVIHYFSLVSICGGRKRKDVFDFLNKLSLRYSFRQLAC